ncbi:MAG: hypothetical protein ABI413_08955 [Ktedonobacteraceae bacterium]
MSTGQDLHEVKIEVINSTESLLGTKNAFTLDGLIARYPEAYLIRPTLPCPHCHQEIEVPHGHLQAYIAHLKSTDHGMRDGALVRIRYRIGCKLASKTLQ